MCMYGSGANSCDPYLLLNTEVFYLYADRWRSRSIYMYRYRYILSEI